MTLAIKILAELDRNDARSDRQLAEAIFGSRDRSNQINGECRHLENLGVLARKKQYGAPILNYRLPLKPRLRVV